MRELATCRAPCEERRTQGRSEGVARVLVPLEEIPREWSTCALEVGGRGAETLHSHFESSIHAALELPPCITPFLRGL